MTKRFLGLLGLISTVSIACLPPLSAEPLPKGVIADSSLSWIPEVPQSLENEWQNGFYSSGYEVSSFQLAQEWISYYPGPNSWVGGQGLVWDTPSYPRIGKYAIAQSSSLNGVRRWVSPYKGRVIIQLDCQPLRTSRDEQTFRLYKNGVLEQSFVKDVDTGTQHLIFVEKCDVEIGDVMDFTTDTGQWVHASVRILADRDLSDILVHYPLDERNDYPSGWPADGSEYDRRSRVGDYSGNDHHAVLIGVDGAQESHPGIHDRARYFDGVDDCVRIERIDVGDGLDEVTLSAWISPEGEMVKSSGFIATRGTQDFIGLFADAENGLVEFQAIIDGNQVVARAEKPVPSGEWSHVVGVWKSGQIHKLYINGEEVASHRAPVAGVLDVQFWHVGRLGASFHGLIDEVMIHERAFVDFEVRDLYRKHAEFAGVPGSDQVVNYYDGVDDVRVLDVYENGASELTLAAWVAPFTKGKREAIISSAGADSFGLQFSVNGDGPPIEFIAKTTALTGTPYSVPTGQWNHVTGVWKSGEIYKLYLNGVEIADRSNVPTGVIDIRQWLVGRGFKGESYHGLVQDIVIETQAYSPSEVLALYRESLPSDHEGPVEMNGFLRWDYAFGVDGYTLDDTVNDPRHYIEKDRGYHTGFHSSAYTGIVRNNRSSSHLRGYVEAPATGYYSFWITGSSALDLSLSPDDQKYTKQRIAGLSPDIGTAKGVNTQFENLWDNFYSQLSDPIHLVAGERYYIDVLQNSGGNTDAFMGIAWARPDTGIRELIPAEFMTPYVKEEGDRDDDYLPDSWEVQYGLDAQDDGRGDPAHQGEWGDFDEDGLRNREEYLLGTDPSNPDTDGDGLSDLAEQTIHNTNPIVSNSSFETVVYTVNPLSVAQLGESWIETGGGVLTSSFRGLGTWDFTVPEDGHYILQVDGQLRGNLRFEDILPVDVLVNGKRIERSQMIFRNGAPGAVRSLSAWLPAGSHTLGLFIDNYTQRRSLEVLGIKVIQPGGLDANGDALPDWVHNSLTQRSQVFDHPTFSYISPAFIEGRSPSAQLVDISTIDRSGQRNRVGRFNDFQWDNMLSGFENRLSNYEKRLQTQMRQVVRHPDWSHHNGGRMEGAQAFHEEGAGLSKWFVKLPLNRNEAIGYVAQMEDLGLYDHGAVVWTPYNVLDGGSLTIPVGSDLLLGAWSSPWDWQQITLIVDGVSETFPAAETRIHHFSQAGTYQISASHPQGASGILTVVVKDASIPSGLAIGEQRYREAALPDLTSDLTLDVDNEFNILNFQTADQGSSARFAGRTPGIYRLAARMSETGAILDQEPVNVVGVSDALRNGGVIASPAGDANYLVRSSFLATYLPAGATIEVVIFAGGVTFQDGTTEKTFTIADLDQNGVMSLNMLMPAERLGAPCHYITIYDANGVKLWNSTL